MGTEFFDEFADFCAEQQARIRRALRRPTAGQKARRIAERPTRAELMREGQAESRGLTSHAQGEKKHGSS